MVFVIQFAASVLVDKNVRMIQCSHDWHALYIFFLTLPIVALYGRCAASTDLSRCLAGCDDDRVGVSQ